MDIERELFKLQDEKYAEFHSRLMPTVPREKIIGVRTPLLRKFAKQIKNTPEAADFIHVLPHKYYEENNLHAFILEEIKDFDTVLSETERFLPYIDNWATCDSFVPKAFKKTPERLLPKIYEWAASDREYTVRYALGLIMGFFLDERFDEEYLFLAAEKCCDKYYINMMIAWLFATALTKKYDAAVPFLTERRLSEWVHNKTIQKACESYRVPDDTKKYLKTLKY